MLCLSLPRRRALSVSLVVVSEKGGRRRRSFQARTRDDDDSGHRLFALFIKRAGICLVGIGAETGEHWGGTAQGRQDLAYSEICS